jgi:hypothetical protein
MESVEWSEILKWVPCQPQTARDQERQKPDFFAGSPQPGGDPAGGSAPTDCAP